VTSVRPTYWHEPDVEGDEEEAAEPRDLTLEEAEEAWAPVAHRILVQVAGEYHGLIQYAELAEQVQEESGIRTRRQVRGWIGPVLAKVAVRNHERDEPPLTALVVHKADGTVGPGYDEVLRLAGDDPIEDPVAREKHAAAARLQCYQWAGADLPEGGGRAALSPRYEMTQARLRKERRAAETPAVCPTCYMEIPPTGVCDNCG
jgi:hypothetical protein